MEYLGTPSVPRRRPTRAIAAAVVAIAVLAGVFVWWTESVRRDANTSLALAVVAAQDQARVGEARVLSTLTYASPLIWSASVPEGVRAGLRRVVESAAGDVADSLGSLAEDVGGTAVLPWQSAQREAREQVLALVDAQQQRFAAIAGDARAIAVVLAGPGPSADAALESLRASGATEAVAR